MIRSFHHLLAIALLDDRIACAQLTGLGDDPRVERSGTMALPDGAGIDQPEALGAQLAAFLKSQRFTARDAVVGVPARWVLAQERELPPVAPSDAAALLRLQAEKVAVSDPAEFVFDYAGQPRSDSPSRALILCVLRKRLAEIDAMGTAAGIRVRSVTPTALAVAQVSGGEGPLLLLGGRGAEVVWRGASGPHAIQHVPVTINGHGRSFGLLCSELRRGATWNAAGAPHAATLVDAHESTAAEIDELHQVTGFDLRPGRSFGGDVPPAAYPAVALGRAALADGGLAADFKHSRLAEAPKRRLSRPMLWGIVIVVLTLLVMGFEVLEYRNQRSELEALEGHAARIAPDLAEAEATIARTTYGRGFYENRPDALGCLLAIAEAFGEAQPVWATSVTFRSDGRAQLLGSARDQPTVLGLLERMKGQPAFADVTLLDLREAAGANSGEVSFGVAFRFRDVGGAR